MISVHVVHITTPCCSMQLLLLLAVLAWTAWPSETATLLPQNKGFLGGINCYCEKKSKERDGATDSRHIACHIPGNRI